MAARLWAIVGCLLMPILMVGTKVSAMSNCDTKSAICTFNARLQGTILFQEKHGFGCSSFGDDEGLHVQIDLQGFDPQDGITSHNFRIKSYAGLLPNCTGMGPDYGQGLRGADLGTFPESEGGVVQISDVTLKNGPTVIGQQSIVGRSVAVMKGLDGRYQQTPQVLGCCIIGVANLQQLRAGTGTASGFNNPTSINNFNAPTNGFGFNADRQPPSYSPFGTSAIRRQSAATRPSPRSLANSFTNSAFRSPFNLDDKFSFFDLTGKTARVNSVLPESVGSKFKAPEPPRFQDIYGLDSGQSPLSRSGYGNTVGPSKGSKLSRMFFQDQDIKSTVGIGLTPEELDIPRESGDEESSRSFHEDKAVEKDPGYEDALDGPDRDYGRYDAPPPSPSFDTPQAAGPLPAEYGNSDLSQASFLPTSGRSYDDDTAENIDVTKNFRNGQEVDGDVVEAGDSPPAAGEQDDVSANNRPGEGGADLSPDEGAGAVEESTSPAPPYSSRDGEEDDASGLRDGTGSGASDGGPRQSGTDTVADSPGGDQPVDYQPEGGPLAPSA